MITHRISDKTPCNQHSSNQRRHDRHHLPKARMEVPERLQFRIQVERQKCPSHEGLGRVSTGKRGRCERKLFPELGLRVKCSVTATDGRICKHNGAIGSVGAWRNRETQCIESNRVRVANGDEKWPEFS